MKKEAFRDEQQTNGIGTIDNITCGYFDCSRFEGLSVSPDRVSTRFEIEYYLTDSLTTLVDDTEYPIKQDYIMLTKPGQHRHSQLPFCTMYLKFSTDGALADTLHNIPAYFPAVNTAHIRNLFSEMILLYDTAGKEMLFHSKLLELLHTILTDARSTDSICHVNPGVAAAAKHFIDVHYARDLSLKDIAKAAALSPNHFHTVFKATCHMTPHDYLIEKRISAAKEMLWNADKSISEIAEACGFGCQQYFTQTFKKHTGITPAKYRKRLLQNYLQ